MGFVLDETTAPDWAAAHGLFSPGEQVVAELLEGGVSANVVALRAPTSGRGFVVKQALPRLRVQDEWLATQSRTETEADAMRACAALTPGAVPAVLASDGQAHVMAMELIEGCTNWQAEIGAGRAHTAAGTSAGLILGTWHRLTTDRAEIRDRFGDIEAFEQLRLRPFHETVMTRLPELATAIRPRVDQLRDERTCLVHGDYAMKNILVGDTGPWVLDFEVAHLGCPLFDLGFFLSFVVLSAVRWETLASELRVLGDRFLVAYSSARGVEPVATDVVAHTACLILARTDGTSPAQFLDAPSRERARERGRAMLLDPARGLWE